MVNDLPLHDPGEGEPSVGASKVRRVHQTTELAKLVREAVEAEVSEDGKEEFGSRVGIIRREGEQVVEEITGDAREEEVAELTRS